MLISNYEPFVSLYNTNEYIFSITEEYGPSDASLIELIYEMAVEYSTNISKDMNTVQINILNGKKS